MPTDVIGSFGSRMIFGSSVRSADLNFLENFKRPKLSNASSDRLHVWFYCVVIGDGGSNGTISGWIKSKMAARFQNDLWIQHSVGQEPVGNVCRSLRNLFTGTAKVPVEKSKSASSRRGPVCHLGSDETGNGAIRSAVPENPTLEPNMKWIGRRVAEIWPFEIFKMVAGRHLGSDPTGNSVSRRGPVCDLVCLHVVSCTQRVAVYRTSFERPT